MALTIPKETYSGKIYNVQLGSGAKAVTIGGASALPFLSFEGTFPNRPAVALEVADIAPDDWPETLKKAIGGVSANPVQWAKFCQEQGADIVALRLIGTHPDQQNKSPEEAAKVAADVAAAIDIPLVILGSGHAEKDTQVLQAVATATRGKNCAIGKAVEENYKTVAAAAMANDHKLIAMSQLDVNLAKQLNILLSQMGFDKERIIMDPMSSALGYGLEYTYSVMERIRQAALLQNDPMMQTPIVCDIGANVWKVKETMAPDAEAPEWGGLEDRARAWEVITASGMLAAGADLLIMRHPGAMAKTKELISELM
ncbi:MAG: acetyl-CoA decarbonylase/synthase complex subunit delta [Nitrospirae bacterium GWC2_57_13]|jgi:acetyl-CoA decarbonylase/synthase, CODH/ACS complex subunit delta|nr:MAG: acetyl-CoA decarbonylase/synthase complex subunit delta [Nitrospirae bacterium GWC1_57_7]OGW28786.1 MAG: acetyl-CoA decarbonylase/synthase complex subunit delta [Nitrospirae bacterium GWC2_57_13]HAS52794.1 acetyl-CoA decarbonylase/synthase complex subunit delta [Nitrospiraceae bacterium]